MGIENVGAVSVLAVHIVHQYDLRLEFPEKLHLHLNHVLIIHSLGSKNRQSGCFRIHSHGVPERADDRIPIQTAGPEAVQQLVGAGVGIPMVCKIADLHFCSSADGIGNRSGKEKLVIIRMG